MYIHRGMYHVLNGRATHKQHMERDKVRYGKAGLSHESSLLLCCQIGGCPAVSQTPNTQNQATSTSASSLIRYRYRRFQISWPNTKLMADMEVQFVDSFTYLGSLITNDVAMYCLSNPLFRKHRIIMRTKINIYRALVVSDLLYGSDAWSTTLGDRRRLDTFNMRCQRCLLRVFWQQHISNRSIHVRTKQPNRIIWKAFVSGMPMLEPKEVS